MFVFAEDAATGEDCRISRDSIVEIRGDQATTSTGKVYTLLQPVPHGVIIPASGAEKIHRGGLLASGEVRWLPAVPVIAWEAAAHYALPIAHSAPHGGMIELIEQADGSVIIDSGWLEERFERSFCFTAADVSSVARAKRVIEEFTRTESAAEVH